MKLEELLNGYELVPNKPNAGNDLQLPAGAEVKLYCKGDRCIQVIEQTKQYRESVEGFFGKFGELKKYED